MSGYFLFILLAWLLVIARSCLVEQNVFVHNFQIRWLCFDDRNWELLGIEFWIIAMAGCHYCLIGTVTAAVSVHVHRTQLPKSQQHPSSTQLLHCFECFHVAYAGVHFSPYALTCISSCVQSPGSLTVLRTRQLSGRSVPPWRDVLVTTCTPTLLEVQVSSTSLYLEAKHSLWHDEIDASDKQERSSITPVGRAQQTKFASGGLVCRCDSIMPCRLVLFKGADRPANLCVCSIVT